MKTLKVYYQKEKEGIIEIIIISYAFVIHVDDINELLEKVVGSFYRAFY